MKTLFIIAITIMVAYVLLFVFVRQKWVRTAWPIAAFLTAGLSAPYLIETTPDNYRFLMYIALALLMIAGVYPFAEKK